MGSPLDKPLRQVSDRLIRQFGRPVTLQQVSSGSYNPATGENQLNQKDIQLKGLIEEYQYRELVPGLIESGDVKLHIAALRLSYIPNPKDRAIIDGVTYEVISTKSVVSGEKTALYTLQLRSRGSNGT